MKLLIMRFSLISHYFQRPLPPPPSLKQKSIFRKPSIYDFSLNVRDQVSRTHKRTEKTAVFFLSLYSKRAKGREQIVNRMVASILLSISALNLFMYAILVCKNRCQLFDLLHSSKHLLATIMLCFVLHYIDQTLTHTVISVLTSRPSSLRGDKPWVLLCSFTLEYVYFRPLNLSHLLKPQIIVFLAF